MAGGMIQYLRSEPPERVMTRIAMGESPFNVSEREFIMWTIRIRGEGNDYNSIIDAALASGPTPQGKTGPGYQYDVLRLIDQVTDPRAEASDTVFGTYNCGHQFNLMIYPCDDPNNPDDLDDNNLRQFEATENLARVIISTPINKELLRSIGMLTTDEQAVLDSYSANQKEGRKQLLSGGNWYYDQFDGDDYLAQQ